MLKAILGPEEAAGRSAARRSAARSKGGEGEERPFSLTVRSLTGRAGPQGVKGRCRPRFCLEPPRAHWLQKGEIETTVNF